MILLLGCSRCQNLPLCVNSPNIMKIDQITLSYKIVRKKKLLTPNRKVNYFTHDQTDHQIDIKQEMNHRKKVFQTHLINHEHMATYNECKN